MIDVNLIPASLRKGGKENASVTINLPKDTLVGVWVGLILLLLTVHLLLGAVWLFGMGRLAGYKASWQQVVPDKNIIDAIYKDTADLKKNIKMISDMTIKKSVLWSPKLNAMSDALPRGVWIKKMTLDKVGLTVEGSVVSKNENEINNVGLFLSTLKQNDSFMKDFSSLEVNSIQGGKNDSVDVTDFSVMAKLK